jgi:hypothetical protein
LQGAGRSYPVAGTRENSESTVPFTSRPHHEALMPLNSCLDERVVTRQG